MGTVERYTTPGGVEGYIARDSWRDASGERRHAKRRFQASKHGGLKRARIEAESWLAQRAADRSRSVVWEPTRETLGSLLDRWAASLGPPLAGSTIVAYRGAVSHRFDARARALIVGDMTRADVRRLVAQWDKSFYRAGTKRLAFVVLQRALRMARDEGGILVSPCDGVSGPAGRPVASGVWSPDQVRAFLEHTAGDELHAAWVVLFATCCRIGELCGLRWSDIDLDAGRVTIRRTWGRAADGKPLLQEHTKGKRVRVVPLPPSVVEELRGVDRSGVWLVPGVGGPLNPFQAAARWRAAVASSGLPRLTPHGARHSGATHLIAAGVSVAVVARILGHADPAMTLRRYVHPDTSDEEAAIVRLDEARRVQSASNLVELKRKA